MGAHGVIEFPTSPTIGDTYTYNTRTWVYNGDGWERQINAGQVVSVFIVVGVLVTELSAFDNSGNAWYQLDYV
jgi:hypothetical protein